MFARCVPRAPSAVATAAKAAQRAHAVRALITTRLYASSSSSSSSSSSWSSSWSARRVTRAPALLVSALAGGAAVGAVAARALDVRRAESDDVGGARRVAGLLELLRGSTAATTVECAASALESIRDASFKERLMLSYENRIRRLSTPEKVFAYFASVTKGNERFMTPEDFIRSLVPLSMKGERARTRSDDDSFLLIADTDGDGLISFEEYLFFTRLLGTPLQRFNVAFAMFDENGDGSVDRGEFIKVMQAQMRSSETGKDRIISGKVASSGILRFFFGDKGDQRLTFRQFSRFMNVLQDEVVRREFDVYDTGDKGYLSGQEFAAFLVSYADVRVLESLAARVDSLAASNARIFLSDFIAFARVLRNFDTLVDAIGMVSTVEHEFDRGILRRAASAAAGVELCDDVIDVVFGVFDQDGSGTLDDKEFLSVLQGAKLRYLDAARDTGFVRLLSCCANCVEQARGRFVQ